eukprot:8505757-Ditylum_brightwellii.AAC.1
MSIPIADHHPNDDSVTPLEMDNDDDSLPPPIPCNVGNDSDDDDSVPPSKMDDNDDSLPPYKVDDDDDSLPPPFDHIFM